MAEVFKATEFGVEDFERTVAVKRILPHVAEDEDFIAMFKDEANIAVQLQHGNIAQIYSLGHEDDSFYIALEYVSGRDLRTIFERSRKRGRLMPVEQACFIMMKVCEGLDYAHNKKDKYGRPLNIIHRDVSPPNVLVSYEGEVKLCDFGVAKAAGRVSQTQAGILKGKFGYMSPEQVRGHALDRRSDVFSVGVCMWELLTGTRLFHGETDFSTLEKVRSGEVEPPRSVNADIPEELEQIVLQALSADPETRFQSTFELNSKLQEFLFRQGTFFSRQDLAAWMRSEYADDIEGEKEREKQRVDLVERMRESMQRGHEQESRTRRPTMPPPPPGASGRSTRSTQPPAAPTPVRESRGESVRQSAPPPQPRGRAQTLLNNALDSKQPPSPPAPSSTKPAAGSDTPKKKSKRRTGPDSKGKTGAKGAQAGDLDWDDDELETRLFESSEPKEEPKAEDVDDVSATAPFNPSPADVPTFSNRRSPPHRPPTQSPSLSNASISDSNFELETEPKSGGNTMIRVAAGLGGLLLLFLVYGFTAAGWGSDTDNGGSNSVSEASTVSTASHGGLKLTLYPESANVRIDGTLKPGHGALRQFDNLEARTHQIDVDAGDAFFPTRRSVSVSANSQASLDVRLEPRDVKLIISVKPSRAKLTLLKNDEEETIGRGSKEHPLRRIQGARYRVRAEASGYTTAEVDVKFGFESVQQLSIDMVSSRSASSGSSKSSRSSSSSSTRTKSAKLKIGTVPGLPPAAVYLDGKKVADRTPVQIPVTPGTHRVQWVWRNGEKSSQRVLAKAGRTHLIKGSN